MASKTPVLDPRNTTNVVSTSGLPRGHVRKDMLATMGRRAKANARRMVRDIKRDVAAKQAEVAEFPTKNWTNPRLRKYLTDKGIKVTTKTLRAELLALAGVR